MRRVAALSVLLLACGPEPEVPLWDNLGNLHHEISANRRAQRYFDQGLRLAYGFNHAEAIKAFREAARQDENCAICFWGVAYAYGPNINAPMDSAAGVEAWIAISAALALREHASAKEQAYIDAMATRYGAAATAERAQRDSAYARAATALAASYPDDPTAAVLAAEAGMLLRPWNYWQADGTPYPGIPEVVATLERVIAADSMHPGACHYYIHAVESSPEPQRALPCARNIEGAMPGAGHMVHMPAHVYLRLGMYADAQRVNVHAAHSDEAFMEGQGEPGFYSMAYYPHNVHFLWAAAAFNGERERADSAMNRLVAIVTPEQIAAVPYLETFRLAYYYHLAWFEQWERALADSAPPASWATSRGLWHYVRGRAFAATNRMREAQRELDSLRAAQRAASALPPAVIVGFTAPATLLDIATDVLAGEIAARAGRTAEAVRLLESAVRKEDGLTYNEPADWYPSVRLTLARVLYDARRYADAENIYREELRRRPRSHAGQFGLNQALEAQRRPATE